MINKFNRGFASDNNAGIDWRILEAISNANNGHTLAYGDDFYTKQAADIIRKHFGSSVETYFVLTGTGANVLSVSALTHSYNSIICAETAHINTDECGAPEKFTSCKLLPVSTDNGKIDRQVILRHLHDFGFEHHVQPKVISISQPTEMGTLYTCNEVADLADLAHEFGMFLHMDGARLANAAVSLEKDFKTITFDAGVDVLSFGGSKNGLLFGEAVIFSNQNLATDFKYMRKQSMQLASKMRYMSAQFIPYLEEGIWRSNALHANRMAQILYEKIVPFSEIKVTQKVQANAVFAIIPPGIIPQLQEKYFFYVWDERKNEVRWMTSFDTTEDDIEGFAKTIRLLLGC